MTGAETQSQASQSPVRAAGRSFGLPQLWALVVLTGVFVLVSLAAVSPHDFWWHVKTGEWILTNGRLPRTDLFSYTQAGAPYAYDIWWLMQVALYLLLWLGGLPLVIFANAVTITAAYALLLRVNWRAAGEDLRWGALATLAAVLLGLGNWVVRPQTISYVFFVVLLLLVERDAALLKTGLSRTRSYRAMWALPPLFAVWANAHAGFVTGLILLAAYLLAHLVAWLRREAPFPARLTLVSALSAVAILLNPLGLGTVGYILSIFRNPVVRNLIAEWIPLTASRPDGILFLGVLAALGILLVASRYRPSTFEAIRLLVFGTMAVMARRNISWFGIVAAPTIATSLGYWAAQRGGTRRVRANRTRLNLAVAALAGLAAVLSLPWLRPLLPLSDVRKAHTSADTPVQAVDFVCTLPQPRHVFHTEGTGSYMTWACPEVPVFIDPRFNLYPEAQWQDYLALNYARFDWQAILDRYDVDTLLLQRESQANLIDAASASPLWQRVYEDEQAVVFVRKRGP
jgi:hypothetical protein